MMTGLFATSMAHRQPTEDQSSSRIVAEMGNRNETIALDVEKLFMITEALWSILKEQHGYTDDDLGEMIQNIDLRDGRLDGKVAKKQNPLCPECGRTLMGKHPVCLYCGTAVVRDPFER